MAEVGMCVRVDVANARCCIYYSVPVGKQSIVMKMLVCEFMWLFSQEPHVQTSPFFCEFCM